MVHVSRECYVYSVCIVYISFSMHTTHRIYKHKNHIIYTQMDQTRERLKACKPKTHSVSWLPLHGKQARIRFFSFSSEMPLKHMIVFIIFCFHFSFDVSMFRCKKKKLCNPCAPYSSSVCVLFIFGVSTMFWFRKLNLISNRKKERK